MLNKVLSGLSAIKLTGRLISLCALSVLVLIVPLVACSVPLQTSTTIKAASSTSIALQATALVIDPVVVEPSEGILITARVTNTNDGARDYTAQLQINGVIEDEKRVIIPAGETYTLKFTEVKTIPGTYSVNLDNLTGQFIVAEPTEPEKPSSPDITEPDAGTPSCCGGGVDNDNQEANTTSGCSCSGSSTDTEPGTSGGCGCGGNPTGAETSVSSGCGCGGNPVDTGPEPSTAGGCGCGG